MTRRPLAIVLAALPVLAGCMHITERPCDVPPWRPTDTVPEESKACVYVFLIDTFDPFAAGYLADLRDHLHRLGFGKTHYGWGHHLKDFQLELGVLQAEKPNARVMVIGFGTGVHAARELVAFADTIGTPVDVAVYLDPTWGEDVGSAQSTFMVRAGDTHPGESHTFVGRYFRKSEVPTHPITLELIEREVTLLGLSVPPPKRLRTPKVFLVPPMPAPRTTIPIPKELPPEWQFLRPRDPWSSPPPPAPGGDETLPYPKLPRELPEPKVKA